MACIKPSIASAVLLSILVLTPMLHLAQSVKVQSSKLLRADPPFSGTIFIDPDIITPSDPTTFQSISYTGQGSRTMYDRRVNDWISVNAYLFNASFDDGLSAEIQVNPEFGNSDAALEQAQKYAPVIGQLPTALRNDLETVWIHKGTQPFGGGNNNLLIHIGQGDLYINEGILEETFVHEASHTSLDEYHASAPGWLAAQTSDGEFISTYARDYPDREDVAETFLTYLAVRYRSDRISQELFNTIVQTIPNRIEYFDGLSLNMYPLDPTGTEVEFAGNSVTEEFSLVQNYPNPFNPTTTINYNIAVEAGHAPSRQVNRVMFVSLVVYDILGREVETLVNEIQRPGNYKVIWDADRLSGGIYIYRLQIDKNSLTRKMLFLK